MKIRISATALKDLERGHGFYARQREDLGVYFLDSLFADIDSLTLYAGVHAKFHSYYRLLAKRFPHAIYYTVSGDLCEVFRVLDCRQKPEKTDEDLKSTR